MGLSESRMRKLMDGQGAGRPGVAGKVGELAETIRAGGWCEEQGSLMRGLAYGILDPERRALPAGADPPQRVSGLPRVRRLAARPGRGAAAGAACLGLGVGALARAGAAAHAGASIGAAGRAVAQARAQAGAGIGGALSASGAAGAGGAAGGTWLLAGGPLGAKLAVGCVIALGVGAGCVALTDGPFHPRAPVHGRSRPALPTRAVWGGMATALPVGLCRVDRWRRRPWGAAQSAGCGQRRIGLDAPPAQRQPRVRARAVGGAGPRDRSRPPAACVGPRRKVGVVRTAGHRPKPGRPFRGRSSPPPRECRLRRGAAGQVARPRGGARARVRRPARVRDRLSRGLSRAGRPCVSRASASGLPRGRSLPVAIARSGSRRSPTMSTQSW